MSTTLEEPLALEDGSLYEVSFLYRDPDGIAINLAGLVDDADFTIYQGELIIWVGTMGTEIIPALSSGRFDLLITDTVVTSFNFAQVKYRFRIHWITKGWESLADGLVTLDA